MKKRAFTLLELLVVLAILAIIAMILVPVFTRPRLSRGTTCHSNLKQIGLAFLQYSQDSAERLPPVAFNDVGSSVAPFSKPYGWADGIQPYIKSTQLLQCPSEMNAASADARLSGFTDYWINSNAAKRDLRYFDWPPLTILCGDGNDGKENTDARYHLNMLPQGWRDDEKSPALRHLGLANYLFADGHVKAFKPTGISNEPVHSGRATFSIH